MTEVCWAEQLNIIKVYFKLISSLVTLIIDTLRLEYLCSNEVDPNFDHNTLS